MTPKYIKQILTVMNGEMYSNVIIIGHINIPFSTVDKPGPEKINDKIQKLLTSERKEISTTRPDIKRIIKNCYRGRLGRSVG